ncbi:type II secretion system protein GspL [Pseudomonas reactans]|uniref:type II secretion system protein GspL n=1 Tax=Pseudomonas reactans TaxID=117680 RepID=UPI0015A3363B|nr:type II secretion system protein GspL [Pseudomonas reactans]NWA64575.1 type II secretory protein pull [Pseudomonas reactans]
MRVWLHLSPEGVADASEQWPCCVWRGVGDVRQTTLLEAAKDLAGQPVHLLLPMEMCSGLYTDVWPSTRRPGIQAIAFAIEEQLGEDLEALHVCAGRRDGAGRFPVLVTHKARLRALLDLLGTLGIEVRSAYVDADLLPEDCQAAVDWYGRRVLAGRTRLAMSAAALAVLEPLLAQPVQWLDAAQSRAQVVDALWARDSRGINLLQGTFARTRQPWPWSTMALSAALWLVMDWGGMQVRIHSVEDQTQRLYAQSVERFQALHPEPTRIVDLAAQLKALQGDSTHPPASVLAQLVNLTEQVIGAGDVDVQRLEYRRGDGWKIQLTANGFNALERLREQGQRSGMPVRIGHASKEGNRVQAMLMLEDPS